MTLREWEAKHGAECSRRHRELRTSQHRHERGQQTYADHMALVDAMEAWLGETNWLSAYEVTYR